MFFITGIIIAALFLISTSMPFLSWILPFYKIKKLEKANLKTKIITNIVAILAIGYVDIKFLITYLAVFVLIEVLYYIFKKYGIKLNEFDKIFITTLIVGTLISIYVYFNRVGFNLSFEQLKEVYINKTSFTKNEVESAFKFMKNNFTYLIYIYISMTVFLTYYFLDKENFLEWNISYFWLIPYIIVFFIDKYSPLAGNLTETILNISKLIYSLYFIKIITVILNLKVKKESICFVVGVLVTLISPDLAFIFGGLASGIKIKVVK
ncbi:MAG: hypothetical protein ACRC0R_03525 [Cetobacterium sp.]